MISTLPLLIQYYKVTGGGLGGMILRKVQRYRRKFVAVLSNIHAYLDQMRIINHDMMLSKR